MSNIEKIIFYVAMYYYNILHTYLILSDITLFFYECGLIFFYC
jgi:hypothetical protein